MTGGAAAAAAEDLSGGCQCGAVRFRVAGGLSNPHLCHCRMCQKAGGNYFLPLGAAARDALVLTRGTPGWFHSSAFVRRGFCAACGTPLFYDVPGTDFVNVTLGSLDEPARVPPLEQSQGTSAQPFFAGLHALPPESGGRDEAAAGRIAASSRQHPDHDTAEWPKRPDAEPARRG